MRIQRGGENKNAIREKVRNGYAAIAKSGGPCCGPAKSCCGGGDSAGVAKAMGYSDAELATLPDGANMGLSCGNPGAIAGLKRGEIVLDLGSGGGLDVFLVAQKVGPKGRAIGVDMTPEMLGKARKNAEDFFERTKLDNVEFRLGEIEHLPVADESVNVVISNCVINLSPDKQQVWDEIARVLKPGGRVAVSDMALLKPLPRKILSSVEALVGCLAGAVLVDETRAMAETAGLSNVTIELKPGNIESMVDLNDPMYSAIRKQLPATARLSDYITSIDFRAIKQRSR